MISDRFNMSGGQDGLDRLYMYIYVTYTYSYVHIFIYKYTFIYVYILKFIYWHMVRGPQRLRNSSCIQAALAVRQRVQVDVVELVCVRVCVCVCVCVTRVVVLEVPSSCAAPRARELPWRRAPTCAGGCFGLVSVCVCVSAKSRYECWFCVCLRICVTSDGVTKARREWKTSWDVTDSEA